MIESKMCYTITIRLNKKLYDFVKTYAKANNSSINCVLNVVISELRERLFSNDLSSNDIDLIDLDDLFEPEDEIKNQKKQKAQVKFLTSEETKLKIKEIAKENYTSVNKYLDIFLTNHIKNDKIKYTEKELRLLHQHNCEVRAIGRNLNQITKQINKGKLKVLDEYIVELIEEVNSKIVDYSNAIRDIIINNKA